jgi:hypothetical protein
VYLQTALKLPYIHTGRWLGLVVMILSIKTIYLKLNIISKNYIEYCALHDIKNDINYLYVCKSQYFADVWFPDSD